MVDEKKEVCTIRIMFPVESDEQAIDVKKKIKAIFPDDAAVVFQFEIMSPQMLAPRPRS